MLYLLKWSSIAIIGFSLLVAGTRILGARGGTLALRVLGPNSGRSPEACWYDICPGQTSPQQSVDQFAHLAHNLSVELSIGPTIESGGYLIPYEACVNFSTPIWRSCARKFYDSGDRNILVEIDITNAGLRLGDLVAILGLPTSTFTCSGVVANIANADVKGGVSVTLNYSNGYTVSAYKISKHDPPIYPVSPDEWRISPDMMVTSVTYYPVTFYSGQADGEMYFSWRGFGKGPEMQHSCGN